MIQTNTPSPSVSTPSTTNPFAETGGWQFKMLDFELLHFYTSATALTMSSLPRRQLVWQNVIPKLAFPQPFLLHGLMALAALHLARLDSSRREMLYAEASVHHDTALAVFRTVMQHITPQNCDACFAFSSVLITYAWASPNSSSNLFFVDNSSPTNDDGTVEWVRLLRGSCTVLLAASEWLKEGPLRPLLTLYEGSPVLEPHYDKPSSVLVPEVREKFAALKKIMEPIENCPELDTESIESLKDALIEMEEGYAMLCANDERVCADAVVFSWPIRVSEHYITMVAQRVPQALVVLAHYCLLLNKIDGFFWTDGMSRHLLHTIVQILGKNWESWISWPLQDLILSEFNNRQLQV